MSQTALKNSSSTLQKVSRQQLDWKNNTIILSPVVSMMDYYAQEYLNSIGSSDNIQSSNPDFEKEQTLAKLVTEEYNNYKRNFSEHIVFDINDDSKILSLCIIIMGYILCRCHNRLSTGSSCLYLL